MEGNVKHRRRPSRLAHLPRLVVPLGLGLALCACVVGFLHFTRITLDKQAHFAPGSEHPADGYAVGCLFLGMVALGGLLLNLRDPPAMRWRRVKRIRTAKAPVKRAKRARRSGTIGLP